MSEILNKAFLLFKAEIVQVAKRCPNLEHLSINVLYELNMHMHSYVVDIPNLVALHQFKRLSSLEIILELESNGFNKVIELN
jgi:hypothetical protein